MAKNRKVASKSTVRVKQRVAPVQVDREPIAIECSGVTHFDAAGLRMLLRFRAETGRELRLVNPSQAMRRALAITRLDRVVEVRSRDRATTASRR